MRGIVSQRRKHEFTDIVHDDVMSLTEAMIKLVKGGWAYGPS